MLLGLARSSRPASSAASRRRRGRSTLDDFRPAVAACPAANTTIAVVATNAALDKAEARRVAIMAQDGFARAIRPVAHAVRRRHGLRAGDRRAGACPSHAPASLARIGAAAADCAARAIMRGVYEAQSRGDLVSYRDRYGIG